MWIGPKQTPVLIICSALGIRPESLGYIINEVVSGGQTCRTSHPQAHGRLMFVSPECSLAFPTETGEKKIVICQVRGKRVSPDVFSWSAFVQKTKAGSLANHSGQC